MTRRNRAVWMTGALAVLLGAACTEGRASFIPVLTDVQGVGSGLWEYDYDLNFASTNGTELLKSGDYITLYNFNGYAGSLGARPQGVTAPANFSATAAATGPNPPRTDPPDTPIPANITFTYLGPTLNSGATFKASVRSVSGPATLWGYFAGKNTKRENNGLESPVSNVSQVLMPASNSADPVPTPEPSSVILTGLGVVGALAIFRRRRARS